MVCFAQTADNLSYGVLAIELMIKVYGFAVCDSQVFACLRITHMVENNLQNIILLLLYKKSTEQKYKIGHFSIQK